MIELEILLAFVAVATGLILLPGPNVLFIVATSLLQGRRSGLLALGGTSTAMLVQLLVAGVGTSALVSALAGGFIWIKSIGAAYLVYLGIRALRTATREEINTAPGNPNQRPFWQGFMVSLSNPKTILFFGAFLPQFVDTGAPAAPQLLTLSALFFVLAVLFDGAYLLAASRASHWIRQRRLQRLQHLFAGGFYLLASLGLALLKRGNA